MERLLQQENYDNQDNLATKRGDDSEKIQNKLHYQYLVLYTANENEFISKL